MTKMINMNVPQDYILTIFKNTLDEKTATLDEKITSLENTLENRINTLEITVIDKIESNREDRKEQISEFKKEVANFHNSCYINMKCHDDRLNELEKFKYMIIAYSSILSIISGFLFNVILSRI